VRGPALSKFLLGSKRNGKSREFSTCPESVTRVAGRYIDLVSGAHEIRCTCAQLLDDQLVEQRRRLSPERNKNASAIVEVSLANSMFQDVQPTFSRIPPSDVKHLKM
jgi:hypothetical protein